MAIYNGSDVNLWRDGNPISSTNRLAVDSTISGGALVTEDFDYIAATYPDAVTEVYTYKLGGAGGTTVAVVTVVYTDATKVVLTSVAKT